LRNNPLRIFHETAQDTIVITDGVSGIERDRSKAFWGIDLLLGLAEVSALYLATIPAADRD